ncbi:MAG: Wzz/FepE/Etk N-terminal domain-containing protein, partial [Sedimentisphaerales bacterium]
MDDTARPRGETDKMNADIPQDANYKSIRQDFDEESIDANYKSIRQDFDEESINLADYIRVISRHRRMIFKICAITVVITAIVSMFLPKSFSATASVVPPMDVLQRDMGLAGGLGAAKNSMLRQVMDVGGISDMYVGILKSRSVADALIERFDLGKVYKVRNSISGVRQILQKRTSFRVTKEGIVNITVEDRDPCRAAILANAYVEELDRQNKRLFVGQATSKKVFLENRLREIEK